MEGGEDAETFASGMAAISTTLMMLLNQGDHIVASADVYGGTYGLMTEELPVLVLKQQWQIFATLHRMKQQSKTIPKSSTLKQSPIQT